MAWNPIGPDFVFAPRAPFQRLSRRNEAGRQGLVSCIAIEPSDPNTVYVVVRPFTGGSSAFRTRDAGASWEPIGDWLRATRPGLDPTWVAIHPTSPATIYLASSGERAVYVSSSRGDAGSWSAPNDVGASPLKLIVDPRGAASPATTTVYAAAWQSGIHRSTDGGTTWPLVLSADPTSFVAHMPATGTAHFWAGSWAQGLWHATDPGGTWDNLCDNGIGLPARDPSVPAGDYLVVMVDYCPRDPDRVYCWFARDNQATGLYTTSAPTTSWSAVASPGLPSPAWGLYAMAFAVAPNSPGDGTTDVLFIGNVPVHRSIDAGQTWQTDSVGFHADIHTFAFHPAAPPAGTVPATYLGCDGGIARSLTAADPAVAIEAPVTDFNQGAAYSATLQGWIGMNHGKGSVAALSYGSPPGASALSYIGCQDSGTAGGEKALGWRSLNDADVYTIATAAGPTGVSSWINYGMYASWPVFRIVRVNDRRAGTGLSWAFFGPSTAASTSNFAVGLDGKLVCGVVVRDGPRTLPAVAAGAQTVTPSSMAGIAVGTLVVAEPGVANQEETVTVTAVTATTFTATFARAHPAGSAALLERAFVGRVGHDDVGTQISQAFVAQVGIVGIHPGDANVLYCATNDGSRVWTTAAAAAAGPATVWTEVATDHPANGTVPINSIVVDAAGTAYVLWRQPVADAAGAVTTPLYRLSGGGWVPETVTGGVPGGLGKLVADPVRADVLYVTTGGTVRRLEKAAGTWTFTDVGTGLPGAPVYDLWIGNVGTAAAPRVMLRATVTTRGVFESDVTAGAVDPPIALYLRDHAMDQALLPRTAEGVPDPLDPASVLYHYMSADVKVDVRTAGGFFQPDPEGSTPLNHVHFDMLRDNSQNLPQTVQGRLHVQVHNRSRTALSGVKAWAIYCRASGGVPALSRSAMSGDAFAFWSQFTSGGDIVPALPSDSPWTSFGAPETLQPIDSAHPQVASWGWTIPTLTAGDTGHYCVAVFVHSAASPIGETTDMSVDSITPRNRQVGQKNLHVVASAGPGPGSGGGGGGGTGPGPGRRGARLDASEYVEFHNPTAETRVASLVFELGGLPTEVRPLLQFTPLKARRPVAESLKGARRVRMTPPSTRYALLRAARIALPELTKLRQPRRLLRDFTAKVLGEAQAVTKRRSAHRLPRFQTAVYEAERSGRVEVRDVVLPPFGQVGALVTLRARKLPRGEHRFHVQQVVKRRVVGGSVYIVGVPDDRKQEHHVVDDHRLDKTLIEPGELRDLEQYANRWRYVPPWIQPAMDEREVELGKRVDPKRHAPTDEDDRKPDDG